MYRTIDSNLVDVFLSATRNQAADAFFRSDVEVTGIVPETITTDKHAGYHRTRLQRQQAFAPPLRERAADRWPLPSFVTSYHLLTQQSSSRRGCIFAPSP
ncbi:hypothetical protein [Azospirillum sp.]|uniref:hypothetical protein n=1 Tax=Azospirillum sp. TaxID=34012 RepID=UPI0039C88387